MMARNCVGKIRWDLKKEWSQKYFYDEEISEAEWHRDADLAGEDLKINATGKMFKRTVLHLKQTDRIRDGEGFGMFETRSKEEVKSWMASWGSIKFVRDLCKRFDLGVKRIEIQFVQLQRKMTVVLKTKNVDQGYEGGICTIQYESERLNAKWIDEERKKKKATK